MSTNNPEPDDESGGLASRVRNLRQHRKLSMRQLAKKAGVTVSYVSDVEAGHISPTIATLRKLLAALDTDLGSFFTESDYPVETKYVFRSVNMRSAIDASHRNTFILPRRDDIQFEVLDEIILPGDMPEFETLLSDMSGYILQGDLYVDMADENPELLHPCDAFYVPAGRPIRGYCAGEHPVRLITVYSPPRY